MIEISQPPGLGDLDGLQAQGVGSLLCLELDDITELETPGEPPLTLNNHDISLYPQGAYVTWWLDAPDAPTAAAAIKELMTQVVADIDLLAHWHTGEPEIIAIDGELITPQ